MRGSARPCPRPRPGATSAEYLPASIAVVAIGEARWSAAFANVPGLWGASLLFFLIVAMLNTYGLDACIRLVMLFLIIIAVTAVAGGRKR
jgi:ribose transport system permease protein